jgi:hypothetical protein
LGKHSVKRFYRATRLLCLLACLLSSFGASADPQSKSYSSWLIGGKRVQGTYTIASREVTRLPAARFNRDLAAVLRQHLTDTISLSDESGACDLSGSEAQGAREGHIRINMTWTCAASSTSLTIAISSLLEAAPSHIHFARFRLRQPEGRTAHGPTSPSQELLFTRHQYRHQISLDEVSSQATPADAGPTILTYTRFGFEHILIGLDHIAFLLTLMLLAQRLRDVIFIVTGFTLGHSITLSLSVLGLATPDIMLVEALIGFTVAMVAIENVSVRHGYQRRASTVLLTSLGCLTLAAAFAGTGPPAISLLGLALFSWCYLNISSGESRARQLRPAVTTLFGLIHGFGFASVLLEVGLPSDAVIPALFGFNLGVELGQIAIVFAMALLGSLSMRVFRWRGRGLDDLANAALCGLGTFWFVQRLYF